MRAVVLAGFGGPDMLVPAEMPPPVRAPQDVLIAVSAAAVNFSDLLIRRGTYARRPELPAILGSDVVGSVLVGDDAGTFARGDRVVAFPVGGGGYAEQVAVDRRFVFAAPGVLDDAQCAGLLMTHMTALLGLDALGVGADDTVLVHAAGGGVGSAAVRLAAGRGARVVGTATSGARVSLAAESGAELVLDRRDGDFAEIVEGLTDGLGVDAVIDPLGGEVFARSLAVIRPRGGIAAIGEASGPWPDVPVGRLVGRNVGLHGVDVGRMARVAPDALDDVGERVCGLCRDGTIRPFVGARFALPDAGAAHALMEGRGHAGKVVLVV